MLVMRFNTENERKRIVRGKNLAVHIEVRRTQTYHREEHGVYDALRSGLGNIKSNSLGNGDVYLSMHDEQSVVRVFGSLACQRSLSGFLSGLTLYR